MGSHPSGGSDQYLGQRAAHRLDVGQDWIRMRSRSGTSPYRPHPLDEDRHRDCEGDAKDEEGGEGDGDAEEEEAQKYEEQGRCKGQAQNE